MLLSKEKAVILIVVHKPNPSLEEMASLRQCFEILGNWRIVLICPSGLDVSSYRILIPTIDVDFIDPIWQSSYQRFNQLKTSPFIYKRYSNYKYLLFYELDSWVFRDDLEFWCDQGYDYIGAPWIGVDVKSWISKKKLYPIELRTFNRIFDLKNPNLVGNGGFSLRKTSSMLANTRFFSFRGKNWNANEDSFFAHYVATFNWFFKIPDVSTALKFSFDTNPEKAFSMNGNQLPFGCHGFSRSDFPNYTYNKEFWDAIILHNGNGL